MVRHVTKERLHLRVDGQHLGMLQPVADIDQRNHRLTKAQQLPAEHIQTFYFPCVKRSMQHTAFKRIDLRLYCFTTGM